MEMRLWRCEIKLVVNKTNLQTKEMLCLSDVLIKVLKKTKTAKTRGLYYGSPCLGLSFADDTAKHGPQGPKVAQISFIQ